MFNIPDQTNTTENDSTDANGQELVFTGVATTHKFTNNPDSQGNPRGAKALVVDVAKNKADVSTFFDTVTTPDTLTGKTAYELTITQDTGTVVTVKPGSQTLATGAAIYAGDRLQISVTGGTVEVNSDAWFSGDIHVVSGNVTVVSTAQGG